MQRVTVEITAESSGRPKTVWFVLETPHNSFEEVAAVLARDKVIHGWRINVGLLMRDGSRREHDRRQVVVGSASLAIMQELTFKLLPALTAGAGEQP